MDDNTSTKAKLGVDIRTDSPGYMTKGFSITIFYADLLHEKKHITNTYINYSIQKG